MSEVKQKCQIDGCTRAASTRCYCCNKSVCTRHFTEHIDAVRAQVDPLADTINTMVEKIQCITIEQLTEASFAELNQWKCDIYKLIDEIFSEKSHEINNLVEKNKDKFVEHKKQQWETIMKIQEDVKQLAEDGDATFEQIELLRNQLASVEANLTSFQSNFLSIKTRVFGQGLVTVSSNLTLSFYCPVSSATDNKPRVAFSFDLNKKPPTPLSSQRFRPTTPTTPLIFAFSTPITQSPSIFGLGSGFQSSPPVHPTSTYSFPSGSIIPTPSLFGSSISPANIAINNTPLPFNSQSSTASGSSVSHPSSTSSFLFGATKASTPSTLAGLASPTSVFDTKSTSAFGTNPPFGGFAAPKPFPSNTHHKK